MKSISMMIAAGLLVGGCSTMRGTEASEPDFTGSTQKTLGQFQHCFTDQFAGDRVPPSYLPNDHGGSYVERIGVYQDYIAWIVDITDTGNERRVVLHAKDSVWGKNKKLIGRVQSCL